MIIVKTVFHTLAVLIATIMLATMALDIWDRFTTEGETWSFYDEVTDATCIVTTVHGKRFMGCLPGDRAEAQSAPTAPRSPTPEQLVVLAGGAA